jgi:prepilin-type N-terminal cleavage/methylation domain-containing protein
MAAEKLAVWTLVKNLGWPDGVVKVAIDKINKFIKKETTVKRGKLGFTMVEILTVVGIIAILVAVLIPALTMVRRIAKETQQKAQLTAIDLALIAFKADYGDYPPSNWTLDGEPTLGGDYGGAQKLTEALLGWDLMGFHPDSEWRADGENEDGTELVYDLTGTDEEDEENLRARRGPYLELGTANAFRLGVSASGSQDGLFPDPTPLEEDTFVICDVFGIKKITLANGEAVKAGTPILYYRANTSSKTLDYTTVSFDKLIYNAEDNFGLIGLRRITDGEDHAYALEVDKFYTDITDPKVTAIPWPYRPDSYILISAGADGLYGTSDDICNF